jgi:hypothetical protein
LALLGNSTFTQIPTHPHISTQHFNLRFDWLDPSHNLIMSLPQSFGQMGKYSGRFSF